ATYGRNRILSSLFRRVRAVFPHRMSRNSKKLACIKMRKTGWVRNAHRSKDRFLVTLRLFG
ncbi:MAG: hypothetical protein ACU85E_15615, partial [Gammaproteobacteria bacterium]